MAFSGDNPNCSDLRRLAKELRARQTLANTTWAPSRNLSKTKNTGSEPMSPLTRSAPAVEGEPKLIPAGAYTSDMAVELPVARNDTPGTGQPMDVVCHEKISVSSRRDAKQRVPQRGTYARSTHNASARRGSRRENTDIRRVDGNVNGSESGSVELDPRIAPSMLSLFDHGVGVAAIRKFYRKRHEEEEKKALEQVRRRWRVKQPSRPLADATIPSTPLLVSQGDDKQEVGSTYDSHGEGGCWIDGITTIDHANEDLAARGKRVLETALASSHVGGVTPVAIGDTMFCGVSRRGSSSLSEIVAEEEDHRRYCIFDNLDSRKFLLDNNFAAGLVRDIKRALRAGRKVNVRALDREASGNRDSFMDCRLMLRTLYMKCVQVCLFHSRQEINIPRAPTR